jgi:hypothetical protein
MNMIRVGIVGVVFATIMVVTESLIFCIVLHAILDLGALRMGDIVAPDDLERPSEDIDDI